MKGAFTEAIQFFASKEILHPDKFYQLSAEARVKAFTVSNITSLRVLKDLHAEVEKVLTEGGVLKGFQEAFNGILRDSGYAPENPRHIKIVLHQNIQTSYSVGRYNKQMERAKQRPWWRYNSIDDAGTTPLCYELGGHGSTPAVCYRYDHPFWNKFYPPNHFGCRSGVDDLSDDDLEEEGITPTEGDLTGKEYYPVLPDGSISDKPARLMPPEGFAVNPGKVAWEPDLSKFSDEERKIFERAFEERFGPVRNMGQLTDRLNGLQENFKLMGAEAVPVKRFEFETKRSGSWDQAKRTIGLALDRYMHIEKALQDGRITSFEQADALTTLCHEFGHSLGVQIDLPRYNNKKEVNYHNLSQLVNESWARLFFPDFCESLKLQNIDQYAKLIFQERDTIYQPMVSNFMQLMEAAGQDRQRFSDLIWTLNIQGDPADYEKLVRGELAKLLPGVSLPENGLGVSLQDGDLSKYWLEIIEKHRTGLQKNKGKIL
ncbi:MAG: phage minor head protein [bacterium]